MNNIRGLCCALIAACLSQAHSADLKAYKTDFVAPIVQDHSSLPGDTQFGSIIYDNNAGAFMGLSSGGTWMSFGGGANTSLSNLASTAVNADILPVSNNTINLGDSSGHAFASVNAETASFLGGHVTITPGANGTQYGITAGTLTHWSVPRGIQFRPHDFDPVEPSNEMAFVCSDGCDIHLVTALGTGVVKTPNHIRSYHTTDPTASVQSSAGSTGTCTLATATDLAGQISVTTSGSGISAGDVCDINFHQAYVVAPVCTVTPVNAAAGANAQQSYFTASTSALSVNFGIAGGSSTTYVFNYHCIEVANRN